MTKKYFTKYLPVEGEIKEGELFKEQTKIYEQEWFVRWDEPDRGLYNLSLPLHPLNNNSTGIEFKEGNKVFFKTTYYAGVHDSYDCVNLQKNYPLKLFLCSRDIQVGDKVNCQIKDKTVEATLKEILTSSENELVRITYKRASYIDLKKNLYKVIGEVSSNALPFVREGMELKVSQIDLTDFKYTIYPENTHGYVYIKCPTCNAFH